ncbi:MAG: hypothetical protein HY731_06855 [Candidatus Tectomicrobia bacterium]|nr:hypothetical protein [Candidatus Tectomicrobia bacterium]
MATAYTPGLRVSPYTTIEKVRKLPLKGKVLVSVGEEVSPQTIVARTELPGDLETVRVNEILGIDPIETKETLKVSVGDQVGQGDLLAEVKSFFGLFTSSCRAPFDGAVEYFSEATGHMGIRKPPIPVDLYAYVSGTIKELIPEEGVIVECRGALIQGIFGVGGERQGIVRIATVTPHEPLTLSSFSGDLHDSILIGGSIVTATTLKEAASRGVRGVIVGGIDDLELEAFLGTKLGVAITGHEEIDLTLILTEGFGEIPMAERTFQLLKSLEGKEASINGATQVRAGALRPEVIIPLMEQKGEEIERAEIKGRLEIGALIRIIRHPYFGQLGRVVDLPLQPITIETGAKVRVLRARLEKGEEIIVPRANVELIE